MKRLPIVFVLGLVLLPTACGGEEAADSTVMVSTTMVATATSTADVSTTATTVATTTTTTTIEADTTTTTTATTTSSTTIAPSVCPALAELPDGTLTFIGGTGDFDGDGAGDELLTYQAAPDAWRVRMVFADGGGADAAIEDAMDLIPPRPIGGFDIDDDGIQEAFLTVDAGASTIQVGIFDVAACVATRVTINGVHGAFSVGASVGAGSGLLCPGGGVVRRTFAQRVDETSFEGGYEEYILDGARLSSVQLVSESLTPDEAALLATFDCGGLRLP